MRRDKRSSRSTSNFLSEGACAPESDDPDEPSDGESLDEEEEELTATLRTANPRKAFNPIGKPQEQRKATSTTRCYGCGQYGHFKSECPRLNRQGPSFTPRAQLECLLCKGNHFVRYCPSLPAAQQATARAGQVRKAEPQKPVSAPSPRPSAPNEPSAVFKRDGMAVLNKPFCPDDRLLEISPLPLSVATPRATPLCR